MKSTYQYEVTYILTNGVQTYDRLRAMSENDARQKIEKREGVKRVVCVSRWGN